MSDQPVSSVSETAPRTTWTTDRFIAWYATLALAVVMLAALGWLLARLLWLPLFFGLFFFLVAGLIVGGLTFRMARVCRPMGGGRIILGILAVTLLSTVITTVWEYRHIAGRAGAPPAFTDARNAAMRNGEAAGLIGREATGAFKDRLASDFAPGGAIGYVRWAIASGEMKIEVRGASHETSIGHRGVIWPIRTVLAMVLLAAGLWLSYDSLRSPMPVSNVLAPGEEYEEID